MIIAGIPILCENHRRSGGSLEECVGLNQFKKSYLQSRSFKVIILVGLIVSGFVFLMSLREHSRNAKETIPSKFPPPENSKETNPLYPPDSWVNKNLTDSAPGGLSGKTIKGKLPAEARAGQSPFTPPPTRVHSLSEAAGVMGAASAEGEKIGVTTTRSLPGQERQSESGTLSGSSLEAPAGIPPGEAGRPKRRPLPKVRDSLEN